MTADFEDAKFLQEQEKKERESRNEVALQQARRSEVIWRAYKTASCRSTLIVKTNNPFPA